MEATRLENLRFARMASERARASSARDREMIAASQTRLAISHELLDWPVQRPPPF